MLLGKGSHYQKGPKPQRPEEAQAQSKYGCEHTYICHVAGGDCSKLKSARLCRRPVARSIKYQKEFFFKAQNSMLVKSFITSDSGNTIEARQAFLQQQ